MSSAEGRADAPAASAGDERYDSYFTRTRPAFVQRLRARKQQLNLELVSRHVQPHAVLELGPGDGLFAQACRAAGVERYVGVEESRSGAARLLADGHDVLVARVPPLPAAIEGFDVVYASHLVEHLAGPREVFELVRSARAALRSGGVLALAFPDASKLGPRFWDCDYTHQWPSTPRRVRQVAADAGLEVVAEHRCCLHRTGVRGRLLRAATMLVPWTLLESVDRRRSETWFRGRMLFAPDVVMVLRRADV